MLRCGQAEAKIRSARGNYKKLKLFHRAESDILDKEKTAIHRSADNCAAHPRLASLVFCQEDLSHEYL